MAFSCPLLKTITLKITTFHPSCNFELGYKIGSWIQRLLYIVFCLFFQTQHVFWLYQLSHLFFFALKAFSPALVYCASQVMPRVLNIGHCQARCNACAVVLAQEVGWGSEQCSGSAPTSPQLVESHLGTGISYGANQEEPERQIGLLLSYRPSKGTPSIYVLFINKSMLYCYVAYFSLLNFWLLQ